MDIATLNTLLSNVAFPIAMCIILLVYLKQENDDHKEESNSMKEAINELKIAIVKLTERLDNDDKK